MFARQFQKQVKSVLLKTLAKKCRLIDSYQKNLL
jgi:hypothetical protein